MKRKAAAAALISTNAVEESQYPRSKKQRVSGDKLQIAAAETQTAIVVYNGGGQPVVHHKKRKSCRPRKVKPTTNMQNGPNPQPQEIPIAAAETLMAIVVYNGGREPVVHHKKRKSCRPRKVKPTKSIQNRPNPKPQEIPIAAAETQMAIVVYNGGEPTTVRGKKKKSCRPREKIYNGPNPPLGTIPNGFKDMIEKLGGTDWRLIIQKGLCKSDMSRTHSRLSMPSRHWVADEALSSELLMMFQNGDNSENHVSLPLIDTKMRFWKSVSLRRWNMKKAIFVIAGEWNDVAAANDLRVKDVIQIWCFKFIEAGRFGLAMVKIESGDNGLDNDISSCIALSSNVDAPEIHPQASNSTSSSTHCGSNQYPTTAYFDFLNTGFSGTISDSDGSRVVTAGSESSNRIDRCGGNSTEAVLSTVADTGISSSDIDLSLHL